MTGEVWFGFDSRTTSIGERFQDRIYGLQNLQFEISKVYNIGLLRYKDWKSELEAKTQFLFNFSLKSANKVTGKNLVLGDLSSSYFNLSFENVYEQL